MKSPVTTPSTVQSCPPTVLPENTTCPLVVETAVSQPDEATDTGTVKISSKHPSAVPKPADAEDQTPCSSSTAETISAMEIL